MQIREYQESDLAALRAIHGTQGFGYAFPDLSNPLFVTKLILCEEGGEEGNEETLTGDDPLPINGGSSAPGSASQKKILGAAFLRLTAEAYLLLDSKAGTPRQRWQWLLALHEATRRDAWQRGLEDVHAWLPPPVALKFGRRLKRLGWNRDDAWTPYCKRLAVQE
jgi:hypothetical protein